MWRRTWWTVAVVTVSFLFVAPAAVADEKSDDDAAKAAVEAMFKSLAAKDIDGLMKVSDVPFSSKKTVVKDRDDLKKMWQKALDSKDFSKDKLEIKLVGSIAKVEEAVGKKLPDDLRAPLEEALGKNYRMVLMEVERGDRKRKAAVGVRINDGKGVVAALVD